MNGTCGETSSCLALGVSMRTARNLSFVLFVSIAVIVLNVPVGASTTCFNFPQEICSGSTDRYGKGCTMVNSEGDGCSEMYETCGSYCDPDSISSAASWCSPNPGGGTSGQCWCSGSQQCTCAASSQSCTVSADCCAGLVCNQSMGKCSTNESPILLNLESNGVGDHLTSPYEGVPFDLNADGVMETVAWTRPNAPVGFLAWDRDENGAIDNGAELFGNHTVLRDGTIAANGFEALQDLDRAPGSVRDGQIDARDAIYAKLRVWLDSNHNGLTDHGELVSLSDAGVTRIFTAYRESRRVDRYGNEYRYVGLAMMQRNGHERIRRIFDVFLVVASS